MQYTGSILALLTAAAGWYYLFYSRAAQALAEFEAERLNRRRNRLRRFGGAVMLLLGAGLYIGFRAADTDNQPIRFVVSWIVNMALMATLVVLALLDVRLTARLRRRCGKQDPPHASTPNPDPPPRPDDP